MKFEVNINKKSFFFLVLLVTFLLVGIFAYAYNSSPANPAVFGHSASEIEGVCRTDGTGCPASASVPQQVYLNNISILVNKWSILTPCTQYFDLNDLFGFAPNVLEVRVDWLDDNGNLQENSRYDNYKDVYFLDRNKFNSTSFGVFKIDFDQQKANLSLSTAICVQGYPSYSLWDKINSIQILAFR